MRELAGHDFRRAIEVTRWPLLDVLLAYRARLRELALEEWRYRRLVWSIETTFAKRRSRPPAPPAILRRRDDADA